MKHLNKLAFNALRNQPGQDHIRNLMAFSNRIEMLEKFISENTHFDGEKIGCTLKHGPTKIDWYKDQYYQMDGTIKLPKENEGV